MRRAALILLILLAGFGMLAYPALSNYLSNKNGSFAIEAYADGVAAISEEEIQAEWDEAVKYNENLSGSPAHDPFLDGSGMAMQEDYYDVLNQNDTMGYVEIPKINVRLSIYHGTSDEALHKGAGHLEGSSLPVGGAHTHTVITGHTGLSSAKMFTDIRELKEGDLFNIHVLNRVLAYRVDQIKIVEPNDTKYLKRVLGEDYATLLTCTPYGVNSHRLLVRGVRVEYIPQEAAAIETVETASAADRTVFYAGIAAASAMQVLILITIALSSRRARKRRRVDELKRELMKW